MVDFLRSFNRAFGISYKAPFKNVSAKRANKMKLLNSLPLVGIITGVGILVKSQEESGRKLLATRAILCGSIIGLPIVFALDLISSLSTQIVQARKSDEEIKSRTSFNAVKEDFDAAVLKFEKKKAKKEAKKLKNSQ